jgi:hypothetical protein
MKRFLLTTFLIAGVLTTALSQNVMSSAGKPANAVFFEIGGHSLFFGFNYDTRFNRRADGIGGRVGLGYMAVSGSSFFSLPVALNYLIGNDGKYFEMGAGATILSVGDGGFGPFSYYDVDYDNQRDSRTKLIGNISFGFRKQPVNGGFLFRAGVAPVFGREDDKSFFFFPFLPYIGVGYSF